MATVLEGFTTEEQSFVVPFLFWAKEPGAKIILKEMFHVYGGKCSSRIAVRTEWQAFR
jgi:hypothetical protein